MLETPTLMCVHKYKEHIVYTWMWIPESTLIVFLDFNNFDRLAGKQDQGTPTSACGNLRLQVCYVALSSHGGTKDKKSGPHNYAVNSSLTDISLLPLKHVLNHVGTPIIPYQCINFMYLSMLWI